MLNDDYKVETKKKPVIIWGCFELECFSKTK